MLASGAHRRFFVSAAGSSGPSLLLRAGVFAVQGRRNYMEDTHALCGGSGEGSGLFGVFDGHGGGLTSHIVATQLAKRFAEQCSNNNNSNNNSNSNNNTRNVTQAVFWDSLYRTLEQDYMRVVASNALPPNYVDHTSLRTQGREGSTAVVAHIDAVSRVVTVANAGDSRCVLCSRNGAVVALSNDHKPTDPVEYARLQANGWDVMRGRIYRLRPPNAREGGLNLSRAIGDTLYGEGVTCTPEVQTRLLALDDALLILGSDGLWDVTSNEKACQTAMALIDSQEPEKIAQSLVMNAYDAGSTDNITALVVKIENRRQKS